MDLVEQRQIKHAKAVNSETVVLLKDTVEETLHTAESDVSRTLESVLQQKPAAMGLAVDRIVSRVWAAILEIAAHSEDTADPIPLIAPPAVRATLENARAQR
jgi:hypothetical protein